MAGLCRAEIRDFALDPDVEESAFEQVADAVRQFTDFPHAPLGHQVEKRSLAHVVGTEILSTEQIYDPKNQSERDAQHDASDDRKIEAAIFALIGDIAGQASKAKRQSPAERKKCANNNEDDSTKEEKLAEFARRVHRARVDDRVILLASNPSSERNRQSQVATQGRDFHGATQRGGIWFRSAWRITNLPV
jgi:hypothetical protein